MMPRSATHWAVWVCGLAAFLCVFAWVVLGRPFGANASWSALLIVVVVGLVMYGVELAVLRSRFAALLRWRSFPGALVIALYQSLGLIVWLGLIAFIYWLFPEYRGGWYGGYFLGAGLCMAVAVCLSPVYFWVVARWLTHEDCALYQMGRFVIHGRVLPGAGSVLRAGALSWGVRGFFLPLMWVYFVRDVERYLTVPLVWRWDVLACYQQVIDALYTVDVGFVLVGYICCSRLFGTAARSTDSTVRGWVIAVVCYQPFWSLYGRLYFAYHLPNYDWWGWLKHSPALASLWACAIVALTALYVWATLVFGPRFSNLSNKGVVTAGPYRWLRHPAYVSKNLSWWLISVPWMAAGGWSEGLRHCLMLAGVNCIYAARAWTEELHMRQDPAYRAYACWVDQHGLVARLRGWLRPVRGGVVV